MHVNIDVRSAGFLAMSLLMLEVHSLDSEKRRSTAHAQTEISVTEGSTQTRWVNLFREHLCVYAWGRGCT